ncbi:hypothetical protein VOI54_17920 [Tamlana sp. 2201CG12-4]|uniref:hypothetical protein n=1 Tax=Tamlana sp. 2201CG12-4 TaxID=3112582 RepID=UPI002DB6FB07|nr:hypothetical protein [Tamlana sp. 2201CG12-4]MEC3908905.1 hypothetical protein [Tamlana sp. 2201CG12-4]
MKKITLLLLFISAVISAQTTVQYNDFRKNYNTGNRGIIIEVADSGTTTNDPLFVYNNGTITNDGGTTVLIDNNGGPRYMNGVQVNPNGFQNRIIEFRGRISNDNHDVETLYLKPQSIDLPKEGSIEAEAYVFKIKGCLN